MPLFGGRRSMLEVQNRALIKTAKQRAERIDELERELKIAASQIGQLQRELQTTQARTGKVERDLQTNQEWTRKLERDLQTLQERTGIERDLQQAPNEVDRLRLEREFYSKRALALEEQNRELSESATNYSLWGQKLDANSPKQPQNTRGWSANSPRRPPGIPCGVKSWNANSTGLIRMVHPAAGSERKAKNSFAVP
jgi:chromosome segregation ATPase